jgi:hypothetical protein
VAALPNKFRPPGLPVWTDSKAGPRYLDVDEYAAMDEALEHSLEVFETRGA